MMDTSQDNVNKRVRLARLSLKHDDFVHDVQFDHFGRRIATCSSDQNIKIWERAADIDFAVTSYNTSAVNASGPDIAQQIADEMQLGSGLGSGSQQLANQWVCTFQIQSKHNGAIWRIAWADPEFGQIIASCGMDQHVFIHKERESGQTAIPNSLSRRREVKDVVLTGNTWEMAWKQEINAPIEDLKFAPKALGLHLSVACADGSVRFFAPAAAGNLNDWQATFNPIKRFTAGCSCIAWNPAFDETPMLLVGYSEPKSQQPRSAEPEADSLDSSLILYRLAGTAQSQQFIQYGTKGQFKSHMGAIHDIAWAPLAGRSFHLIASSGADKRIVVWKMKVIDLFSDRPDAGAMFEEPEVQIMYQVAPQIPLHMNALIQSNAASQAQQQQLVEPSGAASGAPQLFDLSCVPSVLRLKWNVTATCFAGSAEDGTVSVWQRSMLGSQAFTKVAGIKSR